MKTSGITAAMPAQDLGRAKAFYIDKVGLKAAKSTFLEASDGRVGLTVGDGVNQFFVYPAGMRSSGEFTQAVIQVADVRAAVEAMRGRGVEFEEYDTPETRTENGNCTDAGWRRGGVVQGLGRQSGRRRSRPGWLATEELSDPEGASLRRDCGAPPHRFLARLLSRLSSFSSAVAALDLRR
jgi:hypothetical protein